MADTYVLKVFKSNPAGDDKFDHLQVTRNFRSLDKAADMYERTGHVYEQKCNRGDDPSYLITLELRSGKGLKNSKLIDTVQTRRIFRK